MQRKDSIPREALTQVLGAVYQGSPVVMEADAAPGCELMQFDDQPALKQFIAAELAAGRPTANLALHYPEMGGLAVQERIDLNNPAANGATWRYTLGGWGLIQLQLEFRQPGLVGCRIAVNSAERARAWAKTYPHLDESDLRDWTAIEKHARRLIRVLRKYA